MDGSTGTEPRAGATGRLGRTSVKAFVHVAHGAVFLSRRPGRRRGGGAFKVVVLTAGHGRRGAVRLGKAHGGRVVRLFLRRQRHAAQVFVVVGTGTSGHLDVGHVQVVVVQALRGRARATGPIVVTVLVVEHGVEATVLDGRVGVDHAVVLCVRTEALERHVEADQRDADDDEQHDAQDDAEDHGGVWAWDLVVSRRESLYLCERELPATKSCVGVDKEAASSAMVDGTASDELLFHRVGRSHGASDVTPSALRTEMLSTYATINAEMAEWLRGLLFRERTPPRRGMSDDTRSAGFYAASSCST